MECKHYSSWLGLLLPLGCYLWVKRMVSTPFSAATLAGLRQRERRLEIGIGSSRFD